MHDPLNFETRIGDALGRYADLAPVAVDAAAMTRGVSSSRAGTTIADQWRAVFGRGSASALVLLALLAAGAIGAVVVGSQLLDQPPPIRPAVIVAPESNSAPTTSPEPSSTTAPTTSADPATVTASGEYQAIAVRRTDPDPTVASDVEVVAVRADGQERIITRRTAASLPKGFEPDPVGAVSPNGWLAVGDTQATGLILIDLHDPAAPVRFFAGSTAAQDVAWGPDGRIAFRSQTGIVVVDPVTGASSRMPVDATSSVEPLAWAADGTGLVAAAGGQIQLMKPDLSPDWTTTLVPTGARAQGFVPVYDAGRGRQQSVVGDRLALCPPGLHARGACRGSTGYELGRQEAAGALTIWDVTPASGVADDAAFAANGRGMWLLRRDPTGGRFILDRLDDQGVAVRSVTAPMSAGIPPSVPPDSASWPSNAQLEAMAPDDSLARIVVTNDDPDITEWFLLPTDGVAGTYHQGGFAGYLASSVADTLGSGAFVSVPGSDVPAVGHAPELASYDQMDAYAATRSGVTAADPVLLRIDGPASSAGQATIELGSITQLGGHRIAIQFACSGPGSVGLDLDDLGNYGGQCMADDQSWGFFDPIQAPASDRTIPLRLDVDNGAAWRVVVYDLGP